MGQEDTASSCAREDLGWILSENSSLKGWFKHQNKLMREVVESSPIVFKACVDVVSG